MSALHLYLFLHLSHCVVHKIVGSLFVTAWAFRVTPLVKSLSSCPPGRGAFGQKIATRTASRKRYELKILAIFLTSHLIARICLVRVMQSLSPGTTAVSSVMTPNPDGGSPSMTVVEALQQVRRKYRRLGIPSSVALTVSTRCVRMKSAISSTQLGTHVEKY